MSLESIPGDILDGKADWRKHALTYIITNNAQYIHADSNKESAHPLSLGKELSI